LAWNLSYCSHNGLQDLLRVVVMARDEGVCIWTKSQCFEWQEDGRAFRRLSLAKEMRLKSAGNFKCLHGDDICITGDWTCKPLPSWHIQACRGLLQRVKHQGEWGCTVPLAQQLRDKQQIMGVAMWAVWVGHVRVQKSASDTIPKRGTWCLGSDSAACYWDGLLKSSKGFA
jgi:hypothetical protein